MEGPLPRPVVAALLLTALVLAQPAGAQARPERSDGEQIVVTGNRDLKREVRDFVRALTPAPVHGQLSRFEREVCPTAIGTLPSQKQKLVGRMRRVADAAGIPLAREDCSPNVLLIVTEDKDEFINALRRQHPTFLGDMTSREVRRLLRDAGPAAAWQVDGPPLNADGQPIGIARLTVADEQPDADASFYLNDTSRAAARLSVGARGHFAAAVVLVESRALEGLTTTQLADYAAMRAFARMQPSRLPAGGPSTILRVLEAPMGSSVPLTLTPTDLRFLRGLYASAKNHYAGAQRSEIRQAVQAELQRSDQIQK